MVYEKVKIINSIGNEMKLILYGLFKQATIGDVNTPKPAFYDFVAVTKWYQMLNFKIHDDMIYFTRF